MKVRTIKSKTKLKRVIVESIGTTTQLQKLIVFKDGNWYILSESSTLDLEECSVFYGRIMWILRDVNMESKAKMRKDLTQVFKKWEEDLS